MGLKGIKLCVTMNTIVGQSCHYCNNLHNMSTPVNALCTTSFLTPELQTQECIHCDSNSHGEEYWAVLAADSGCRLQGDCDVVFSPGRSTGLMKQYK